MKKPINNKQRATNEDNVFAAAVATGVGATIAVKTIILFAVLGVILVGLILGLVLLFALDSGNTNTDTSTVKIEAMDGEDVFNDSILLVYPMLESSQLTKIEIFSEDGDYEFVPTWNEDAGKYKWKIKGYESMLIDQTGFEMMCVWLTTVTSKEPVRNATEQQLKDFGVDESCKNGYAIYFKDETGKEQSYRVRVGNPAYYDNTELYYAYVEGRNHVYKVDNDVKTYSSNPMLRYLQPIINTFFTSETNALRGIETFGIYITKGDETHVSPIVTLKLSEKGESSVEFEVTYAPDEYGRKRKTVASGAYLGEIFTLLYTAFSGDDVMCVSPTDEELKQYGLSKTDEKFFIDATFTSDAVFASSSYKNLDPSFYISKKIEGRHYILSKYHGTDIVVSVSSDSFGFLKTDNDSLLKWTDTTSVKSGFYESIEENSDTGAPGVKKIVLKTSKNEETFILTSETGIDKEGNVIDILVVTAQNSGLVFKDNLNAELAADKNQFRTLYVHLLYYPFIEDFNKNTNEEIEKIINENNIAYSVTAYLNDGTIVTYEYYELSVNLAMEREVHGKVNNDGTITYEEPIYNYIVTMEHIRNVCRAIDDLLAGEHILAPI